MTDVLPLGYVTLLDAAGILQPSMFAGVPDEAAVKRLVKWEAVTIPWNLTGKRALCVDRVLEYAKPITE